MIAGVIPIPFDSPAWVPLLDPKGKQWHPRTSFFRDACQSSVSMETETANKKPQASGSTDACGSFQRKPFIFNGLKVSPTGFEPVF